MMKKRMKCDVDDDCYYYWLRPPKPHSKARMRPRPKRPHGRGLKIEDSDCAFEKKDLLSQVTFRLVFRLWKIKCVAATYKGKKDKCSTFSVNVFIW